MFFCAYIMSLSMCVCVCTIACCYISEGNTHMRRGAAPQKSTFIIYAPNIVLLDLSFNAQVTLYIAAPAAN